MLHSPAFSLAVCLLLVLVLCAPCALADALPLPASKRRILPGAGSESAGSLHRQHG